MELAYKAFYRVFNYFSYLTIPHDAGDFSLLDKRVVQAMLQFPERDLFLRGVRAFAGFKQTGVDYIRPERMFGVTTNSFFKNIGWAKKGILSFSNVPLNMLTGFGIGMLLVSMIAGLAQALGRIFLPGHHVGTGYHDRPAQHPLLRWGQPVRCERWSASTSPRSSRR